MSPRSDGNWAGTRGFPDVADYPNHDSCLSCHRQQFFAGPKPAICAVCHSNVSPRGDARFAFPLKSRKTEFQTIFKHDLHQDIIAANDPPNLLDQIAPAHLVNAVFNLPDDKADDRPQFNNCAICHATAAAIPKINVRQPQSFLGLVAAAHKDSFAPTAEFFKTAPENHASCFNCHYQNLPPTKNDCAKCHRLTTAHFEPNFVARTSLKFNHEQPNHNNKDCTTCHLRITQNNDLRLMRDADVPVLTCSTSSCHAGKLKEEIASRNDSLDAKKAVFECAYCHTSPIGAYQIPLSHENIK